MLYKFNYEYDEDRLMKEAKGTGYVPFGISDGPKNSKASDVGNQRALHTIESNFEFDKWKSKNLDKNDKIVEFYKTKHASAINQNLIYKPSHHYPYATSIVNYFSDLTGFDLEARFYLQKSGYRITMHKDKSTCCSINMLLGEGNDPIKFIGRTEYYKTALLNVKEFHGVDATQDRYLFRMSFFNNSFEEVKNVLSSKLSGK